MLNNDRGFELYESSTTVKPAAKFKTSPRIFGGFTERKASAINSGFNFSAVATADAASEFIKLCAPVIGKFATASPSGVFKRNRIDPNCEVSISLAVTSAWF